MYRATCSQTRCKHEESDESFDAVVDAMIEHLYEVHGIYWRGDSPLAASWDDGRDPPKKTLKKKTP